MNQADIPPPSATEETERDSAAPISASSPGDGETPSLRRRRRWITWWFWIPVLVYVGSYFLITMNLRIHGTSHQVLLSAIDLHRDLGNGESLGAWVIAGDGDARITMIVDSKDTFHSVVLHGWYPMIWCESILRGMGVFLCPKGHELLDALDTRAFDDLDHELGIDE